MRMLVLVSACLLLAACDSTPPNQVKDDPSYSADIQPIFNASCVACHSGSSPNGNYNLSSRAGALGTGTDSTPNVIGSAASVSLLFLRLDAGTMPPADRLDTVDIYNVRNWIDQGAKDN
ncbi:MAG: c-type cytochrome domain-containing protein [bacterium]